MTHREIVAKILAYHPNIPDYQGCDDYKCGDPEDECTGIVTAMVPTVEVIRKTAELGANLLVVHEPSFYTSQDGPGWFEPFANEVFEEKKKLLGDSGITIWRDHDHMHCHQPDGIFTGVLKYMGWAESARVDTSFGGYAHFISEIPETTVGELCGHIIKTLNLNGLRYIGNPEARVKKLALVGHLYPNPMLDANGEYSVRIIKSLEEEVDVIIPGEVIEWTVLSYVRDAVQQGRAKAMISIGHFNWEELGMRYTREWLSELLENKVPVTYVTAGDMYRYIAK
ncbi:MAG: Nif3-like dinuclear metal center hexameric protein [Clostridiales bacterium]|nr:Nif3-like dinuclear metal center hexameric protein [Clostridiales bacterium]